METDAPSFEKIDYSLRPAKSTERWMLVEALGHLEVFAPLREYTYIGFGSPFFVDFRLFHRRLAITQMHSIEAERDLDRRFELNKPYEWIRMEWGRSTDVLPSLARDGPSIVWLDYDYKLDQSVLADIDLVVERSEHGDCFLATVDAELPDDEEELEAINQGLGSLGSLGPLKALVGWRLAEDFYRLMHSATRRSVQARGDGLAWVQLFHFHYRDSARMLTYGGVFVDEREVGVLEQSCLENLEFTALETDPPFKILMPQLTRVETSMIDKHMPNDGTAAVQKLRTYRVPAEQVERYTRLYRHAPAFPESQV